MFGINIRWKIQECLVMNIFSKFLFRIEKKTLFNRISFSFFYSNKILGMSSGIDDLIGIRWDLAACLFICWAIVFACLYNGLKSMGKVYI